MSHPRRPAPEEKILSRFRAAGGRGQGRDITPAVGTCGGPAPWRRAVEGAVVRLARRGFGDARSSYLYRDTGYAEGEGEVADAARRMRGTPAPPEELQGPFIHPAVWTWEVPLYFWVGGIAAGSSFVALAADLAGDHHAAATARRVGLAAAVPSALLLVKDLGRPERFLNMLRIFKPRSPMSMGAWCLSAFTSAAAGSVAADLAGRGRLARRLGAATALLGTYLGSYTGVLLASTAVPVWARSRLFLGPIFICTAAATGAATNGLVLAAGGMKAGHPTRNALRAVENVAIAAELALSSVNEKRLGRLGEPLGEGRPGRLFQLAKWGVRAGLGLRLARGRRNPAVHHVGSVLYIVSGLAFRFAWVGAGRTSARDDEAVARAARG